MNMRTVAERTVGPEPIEKLEQQGLTVIPKVLIDQLRELKGEEILIIEGRAILVRPASPNDVDRVHRGIVVD